MLSPIAATIIMFRFLSAINVPSKIGSVNEIMNVLIWRITETTAVWLEMFSMHVTTPNWNMNEWESAETITLCLKNANDWYFTIISSRTPHVSRWQGDNLLKISEMTSHLIKTHYISTRIARKCRWNLWILKVEIIHRKDKINKISWSIRDTKQSNASYDIGPI